MRLTQYTDFSLRVLIYLGLKRGSRSTIKEISEAYDISRNHLMKVVQQLVAHGYLKSTRGAGGGLRLQGEPKDINLGKVVRDMEPDFGVVECFRPENRCIITPACRLPAMLSKALDAFHGVLDQYTLADLLPETKRRELEMLLKVER